ncbi:pPIWI_RE module domain-containing protein [Streptosporangium saharense]|uniref:pPIWI_RE module domain-containing protein n=1 Tax=Streptosporangium saharense TaxID=1706840 RepID=UPI00331E0215
MIYSSINLAAYELAVEYPGLHEFQILRLPSKLREAFLELYRSDFGEEEAEKIHGIPIRSLNALLPLAAPDVISVGRWVAAVDDVPWLYARHPVPMKLVRLLLRTWIRSLPGLQDLRNKAETLIEETEFDWNTESVDLRGQALSGGGTALPDGRLYHLLPDIAARLTRAHGAFTGTENRAWSYLETPGGGQGAELLSWPPRKDNLGNQFSYVIAFSLHTLPFSPLPRLHVRTGIRRWVTEVGEKGKLYSDGRKISVFIASDTPWPGSGGDHLRMARHHLHYDSNTKEHAWVDIERLELLPAASLLRENVKAAEIGRNPAAFLQDDRRVRAAVTHHTTMDSHGVGAGLMAGDRVPMMEWIDAALAGVFKRADSCQRSDHPGHPANKPVEPTFSKKILKEEREQRRQQFRREHSTAEATRRRALLSTIYDGRPFTAVILWQNSETRDALIDSFRELLDLPLAAAEGDTITWNLPEVSIRLRLTQRSEPTRALEVRGDGSASTRQVRAAISKRRAETAQVMGESGFEGRTPDAAIVEIARKFEVRKSDPKHAVRLGCADTGTLTQFIQTTVTKELRKNRPHRAKKSWLDVFRQLGASPLPEHTFVETLPAGLQYVAIWMTKRQRGGPTGVARQVPIAVRVRPGEGADAVQGWHDGFHTWIPYRDLLTKLASENRDETTADEHDDSEESEEESADESDELPPAERTINETRQQETAAFLRALIAETRDHPTLLLTHAQNLRSAWPWLQNAQMEPDLLWLADAEPVSTALYSPNLRHIRVRTSDRDETPQWYGGDEGHGLPASLWRLPGSGGRVFYSSADRPATARKAAISARKEGTRTNKKLKEITDTHLNAFNPRLLELTVQSCSPSDIPSIWAACAHQLRYPPEISAPALQLPLPLHLAAQVAAYLLPTGTEPSQSA